MKNIFITGAKGFIGRNLCEYLQGQYNIFAPSHSELELLEQEKVKSFVMDNKIDIIIHCASVGGSRKTAYDKRKVDIVSKNLCMFFNVTRTMGSDRRMLFLGSGAEYDIRHYKPHMPENYFDEKVPQDSYGFSKYACSKYIMAAENIIGLRLFGVFGKYEDYTFKFISNAIVKNLLGLPILINQNVYFDYLYIDDLVRIIEHFIAHKPGHKVYNLATGKSVDLVTIANKINQIAGNPSEVVVKNEGLGAEYSADNARLLNELKGFKFTPFDKALEELYLWYKANLDKIDREAIVRDDYINYCRVKKGSDEQTG